MLAGVVVLATFGAGLAIYHVMPDPSAEQYIEESLALKVDGQLGAAVTPLKTALQQDPDNTDARWLLSEIYLEQGDGSAAFNQLVKLQELGREGRDVTYRLIRAMLLERRFDDALARLAFMKPAPEDPAVYLLRGKARLGLDRMVMASTAFNAALRVDASNPEAHHGLASAALAQANIGEAQRHIGTAIELDPGNTGHWQLKGAIELSSGDPVAAETAFTQALARNRSNLSAGLGMIEALLAQQRTEEASTYLARLHRLFFKDLPLPGQTSYHYLVARRDLARGMDFGAAEQALLQALKLHPEHPPSLMLMGWVKLQQGENETAEHYLTTYHAREPNEPAGTRLLAEVLLLTGQTAHAIEMLSRAVEQRSGDVELVAMLGDAYRQAGDHSKAQEMLELAVSLAPGSLSMRTRLASSLIDSGELAQGARELATVMLSNPDDPRAEYLQALVLFKQGDYQGALAKAATLAEKWPGDPQPVLLSALVLERRGNIDRAGDAYLRALERDPRNTDAMYSLARISREAGEIEIASERFRSVLQLTPGHLLSLTALARIALDNNRPDEALLLLEQARDANPQSPGLNVELASLYSRQGRSLDALNAAQQAAMLAPNKPEVMLALGQAQLAAGHVDAAQATLRGQVALFPDSADVHFAFSQAQLRANDIAGARNSLQHALDLAPDSVRFMASLADLDLQQGRYDVALGVAREIQKKRPGQALGYLLEGDVLMARQQTVAAIAAYEAALEQAQTWPTVNKLQVVYRQTGETGKADDLVRGWFREHPADVAARVALAQDMLQRGELEQATREFERALQYQPDNVLILNNLARLHDKTGEPQALEYAQRAHELQPNNAQVQSTYGKLLVAESQDPRQGLVLLEEAIANAPDDPEIRYNLAAALALTGDPNRARKEMKKLLAMNQDVIDTRELSYVMNDLVIQ